MKDALLQNRSALESSVSVCTSTQDRYLEALTNWRSEPSGEEIANEHLTCGETVSDNKNVAANLVTIYFWTKVTLFYLFDSIKRMSATRSNRP